MANTFIVALNRDGKAKRGEALRWLDEVAIPFTGDECLCFPFHRAVSGHGRLSGRNGPALAHQYVLEATKGPRPSPAHEGCHECGKGWDGCVNPRHLYWGTRSDNMQDRKRHGVLVAPPILRGASNYRTVLTEEDVRKIRALIADGVRVKSIADEYGVTVNGIYSIKYRNSWAWLP